MKLRTLAFAASLAFAPAFAAAQTADGVNVGKQSRFAKLVPAETLERQAAQQYAQMLGQAKQQNALAPDDHPQTKRLRAIAQRLVPLTHPWNPRAKGWQWEVNLIGSTQINAFCMPGGKIAFYSGILDKLQLTDDEVAAIMGHEMAHALREHARERIAKTMATQGGISIFASLLGLGDVGRMAADMSGKLLTMKFGREDESESDLIGLELSARAGYDPRAGVTLWKKMAEANKGAPPQWLSTHPSGDTRIKDMEKVLPKVLPLYEKAAKPPVKFGPAPQAMVAASAASSSK
jgi:predicted Zn-dependent protease